MEIIRCIRDGGRRGARVRFRRGIDLFEKRYDLMPDEIPGVADVGIGRIRPIGQAVFFDIRHDFLSCAGEERPHDCDMSERTLRRNAGKSGKSRAAAKMKNHRFEVIARRMRKGNGGAAVLFGLLPEHGVADIAGGLFKARAAAYRRNVDFFA